MSGMHIYPFERYVNVMNEAVTEIDLFLMDRKHLPST